MKTVLKTCNRSKVKTGNPKTVMTTGFRSKIFGSLPIIVTPGDFRLLEDGDFRILEDSDFRILQ